MNPQRLVRIFAVGAIASALSACAGVPLSTMWHFRNFGPNTLVQTDPVQVRSALRSWSNLDFNNGAPQLHVTLQFKGEEAQDFKMSMSRITGAAAAVEQLPNPGKGREWYVFALSPAGIAEFRKMQRAFELHMDASGELKKHGTVTIKFDTDQMQPSADTKQRMRGAKKIPIELRLELSKKDGYYTLYSGEMPVKYLKPVNDGAQD